MPMPKLEVFETAEALAALDLARAESRSDALDDGRTAAYEQGYRAGWDDAAAALTDEQSRLSDAVGRNLQALALTHDAARSALVQGLAPLLSAMVTCLLPAVARESLGPLLLETLRPLAEAAADQPAVLTLHPASRPRVEALLAEATPLAFRIEEDPGLDEGQVHLRLGPSETNIDLTRATERIAAVVRDFFNLEQEKSGDGRPD